jgi:hypothetical protein
LEKLPQRQSGIERVLGSSSEKERGILRAFRSMLKRQKFQEWERRKTPEETMIIGAVLRHLPEFIAHYGGTPVVNIDPDVIHILDEGKLTEQERAELSMESTAGGYLPHKQQAVVVPHKYSRLKTAERLTHELMHLESFASLDHPSRKTRNEEQRGPSVTVLKSKLFPRRIGLSIFDKTHGIRFFRDIDEAVIEELTIRFDQRYFAEIPSLEEEIAAREAFKREVNGDTGEILSCITREEDDGTWTTTVHEYAYAQLRENLWSLIDQIYKHNSEQFASKEEIFTIFAKAVLTGRLLELGRLVEKTFGKGSFRGLGQKTAIEAPQGEP